MATFVFASTPTANDELGVWQPATPVAARDITLEAIGANEGAAPGEISAWHVSLPGGPREAGQALSVANARIAVAEAALPYASLRLAAFRTAAGPSPAIPIEQAGPELTLADWVKASGTGRMAPDAQSGLAQVGAFLDKVRDTLRNYAAIDTDLGGRRTALTVISWSGDFRTAWASGLALDDAERHTAAVALALRTRDAWLRLALTVLRGAVQLAALFAANPALALPASYSFIRQVIDQVQALHGLPCLHDTSMRRSCDAG